MSEVDPILYTIPEQWRGDPQIEALFEIIFRALNELRERTGGNIDTVEQTQDALTGDPGSGLGFGVYGDVATNDYLQFVSAT